MPRIAASCVVLAVLLSCAVVRAEEPQEKWMKYFEGKWELKMGNNEGIISEWKRTPAKNSLISMNDRGTRLMGWESQAKKLVVTSYDANGMYYRAVQEIVDDTTLKGVATPGRDGEPMKFTIKKTGDSTYVFYLGDSDAAYVTATRLK